MTFERNSLPRLWMRWKGWRMNELALFAGAGGGILGGKLIGWRTVCAVENDQYARDVLVARQNDGCLSTFPIWDDVCTFDGRPWRGIVDVVSGGFPCQAFSTAARGRNTAGTLWPEMLRIVGDVCPQFVFAENVSEDAIADAQADLTSCGYRTARTCLSAEHVGADHSRRRWWLVGDADNKGKLGCKINAKVAKLSEIGNGLWPPYSRDSRVANGVASRVHINGANEERIFL